MSKKQRRKHAAEDQEKIEARDATELRGLSESDQHVVVPLVEEDLRVEKRWAQAGEVLLRKSVEERPEIVPVELAREAVHVERVPVNRALAHGETAEPRREGDTWIFPVVEEELVVTKRRVVREELRLTKRREARQEEVREVVRRERLDLESTGSIQVPIEESSQQP